MGGWIKFARLTTVRPTAKLSPRQIVKRRKERTNGLEQSRHVHRYNGRSVDSSRHRHLGWQDGIFPRICRDAPQWAEQKAATLVETLRDKPPYEIQEHCFQFAANGDNYDPAMIPKMQMNAYNHGLIEEHVRKVFGIVLRDAVLAKLGLQAPE